jgi:hypothetical protein
MKRLILAVVMVGVCVSGAGAADWRLGPFAGASLLTRKDTSLTHATLTDEVTLGRSVLGGLALEVGFENDRLAFEGAIGPYRSDIDRSCITPVPGPLCTPEPTTSTSHVLFYGMHYRHLFGDAGWRPSLGLGLGGKKYSFKEEFLSSGEASPTFEASIGAERAGRTALRIEARGVYVTNNPLILDRSQFELQVRMTVLFALGH